MAGWAKISIVLHGFPSKPMDYSNDWMRGISIVLHGFPSKLMDHSNGWMGKDITVLHGFSSKSMNLGNDQMTHLSVIKMEGKALPGLASLLCHPASPCTATNARETENSKVVTLSAEGIEGLFGRAFTKSAKPWAPSLRPRKRKGPWSVSHSFRRL